jgi:hypothetical protein
MVLRRWFFVAKAANFGHVVDVIDNRIDRILIHADQWSSQKRNITRTNRVMQQMFG